MFLEPFVTLLILPHRLSDNCHDQTNLADLCFPLEVCFLVLSAAFPTSFEMNDLLVLASGCAQVQDLP